MTKNCLYAIATFGAILVLLGVILALVDKEQFMVITLSKRLALRNDTDAMNVWKATPFPILFKVYFWNVTNPEEVSEGAKPKLVEVGPYVYEQWLEKVNVKEDDNDTLSYNPLSRMEFSEELTGNLKESDRMTIINLPIVGIILRVNEMMPEYLSYLEGVWAALLPGMEDIFLRGTVRDLLFDGITIDCTSKDFMVTTVCNSLNDNLPKTIRKVGNKSYKFSFFHYKTQVSSDVYRVYRGIEDFRKLGQIFSFNGDTSVKKWKNQYCDMVNGSDGSQMPTNLSPSDTVYLFQADFCRSLYAKYEKTVYKGKVKLLRFVNTPDLFAPPEKNPDNECFCAPKADISEFLGGGEEVDNDTDADEGPPPKTCVKTGAMILTPCLGAPVVITFPHFYMGDESYLEFVNLSPKKELHETFVDVEPISGIPFAAKKRIQFNTEVKSITDMSLMENLAPGLFPVLWVEESMELTSEYSSQLETLFTLSEYMNVSGYALIGIGTVLLIAVGMYHMKKNKTQSWEPDADAEPKRGYNGYYSNRYPAHLNNNGNREVFKTHLGPNYPVLISRQNPRVFPNSYLSGVHSENFM